MWYNPFVSPSGRCSLTNFRACSYVSKNVFFLSVLPRFAVNMKYFSFIRPSVSNTLAVSSGSDLCGILFLLLLSWSADHRSDRNSRSLPAFSMSVVSSSVHHNEGMLLSSITPSLPRTFQCLPSSCRTSCWVHMLHQQTLLPVSGLRVNGLSALLP